MQKEWGKAVLLFSCYVVSMLITLIFIGIMKFNISTNVKMLLLTIQFSGLVILYVQSASKCGVIPFKKLKSGVIFEKIIDVSMVEDEEPVRYSLIGFQSKRYPHLYTQIGIVQIPDELNIVPNGTLCIKTNEGEIINYLRNK